MYGNSAFGVFSVGARVIYFCLEELARRQAEFEQHQRNEVSVFVIFAFFIFIIILAFRTVSAKRGWPNLWCVRYPRDRGKLRIRISFESQLVVFHRPLEMCAYASEKRLLAPTRCILAFALNTLDAYEEFIGAGDV